MKRITDRQSFWMHAFANVAMGIAGIAIIAMIITKLIEYFGG